MQNTQVYGNYTAVSGASYLPAGKSCFVRIAARRCRIKANNIPSQAKRCELQPAGSSRKLTIARQKLSGSRTKLFGAGRSYDVSDKS